MISWAPKRPSLLHFFSGALFMATLGAPLWGLLSSTFWVSQANLFDGKGDDTLAAEQLVRNIQNNWGDNSMPPLPTLAVRPNTGDKRNCDSQLRAKAGQISRAGGHDIMGLFKAALDEERALDKDLVDREAANTFAGLPKEVLAPLAQCTAHSLAAPLCTMLAAHYLENDKQKQEKIKAAFLENAKAGDDQACLVLDSANRFLATKSSL